MSLFRSLYSFTKREINDFFESCTAKQSIHGLKLLIASPLENQQTGKLLIIVPKSFGNAPARNRIRRQIKSIYFNEKLYATPSRAALLVYPQARYFSFDELRTFLRSAFIS